MTKVLITGGAGFIGSHTTRRFLDAGIEVAVLDAFHVYILPIQPWFLENMNSRFSYLLRGGRIIRGSTLNKDDLRRTVFEVKPECIVHFAALPLANVAVRKSEEAFQGILQGTVNILEVLRDVDFIQRFVYISSSMVYGDFEKVPVPEDARKNPKDIYGGMKLAGEILTKVYALRYNIPYTIIRPSAVYGPTDNNRRVVQIFLENAFAGRPIQVVRGPDTVLDFTYVKDIAEGIFLATISELGANQIFNITRGEGRSLSELVNILRKHFPNLQVKEKEETDSFRPRRGALDISKARQLLGYNPKWSLEKGVEDYIDFIRKFNPSMSKHHE
ncbi:3-beta hydroxysteroid dehydrogenase [Candidatus Bathyarchaeota archaeon]|nr:MAG: 3-beta hydroxysteroid dehydrogenase [Candidatus Bathyarchaeota archaeon]